MTTEADLPEPPANPPWQPEPIDWSAAEPAESDPTLEFHPDHERPAPPDRGVGRFFRMVIGIREPLLDWVPEERARYSRMGAVVLATGILAAVSMIIALSYVSQASIWVRLPIGLAWAALIIAFDSWLIASTHGSMRLTTLWTFLPRLIVSVLIGVIVAEPLIMTVFRSSISVNINTYRSDQLHTYEALLTRCNPTNPAARPPADCGKNTLTLANSPVSIADKLSRITVQRNQLQTQVTALNKEHARLVQIATDECAGTSGRGLTGVRGEGQQCLDDKAQAKQFSDNNQIPQKVVVLGKLNDEIDKLAQQKQTAFSTYASTVHNAIKDAVAKRTKQLDQPPGLLDADAALGRLAKQSFFVMAAEWLLRGLLVAIDLLPVLVKVLGGKTAYDALTAHQLDHSLQMHQTKMQLAKRKAEGDYRVGIAAIESNVRRRIGRIQEAERIHRAGEMARKEKEVASLAAQLRGMGRASGVATKVGIDEMTKRVPMNARPPVEMPETVGRQAAGVPIPESHPVSLNGNGSFNGDGSLNRNGSMNANGSLNANGSSNGDGSLHGDGPVSGNGSLNGYL
jgi:hypothetical protein